MNLFKIRLRHLVGAAVAVSAVLSVAIVSTQQTGEHYGRTTSGYGMVPGEHGRIAAGPIEVIDFFFYGCPHCNGFEPGLQAWLTDEGKRIRVRRVPVGSTGPLIRQAALYYTLLRLGQADRLHGEVYAAIHKQSNPLDSDDLIIQWAADHGIPRVEFEPVYRSPEVAAQIAEGRRLFSALLVDAVPTIVVAGRWVVSPTTAGGAQQAIAVLRDRVGTAQTESGGGVDDQRTTLVLSDGEAKTRLRR